MAKNLIKIEQNKNMNTFSDANTSKCFK